MVTIIADAPGRELVTALHAEIGRRGAEPVTVTGTPNTAIGVSGDHVAAFLANHEGALTTPEHLHALVEGSDVLVAVRSDTNTSALSHVSRETQQQRTKAMGPVLETMTEMDDAVLTLHPTDAWAQRAGMSLPEYEEFVYGAMLRDWESQDEKQERLRERVEAASEARIVGPNTDLRMSLHGMHAVNDIGDLNFPPGEVYTAPVVDSVEGQIHFDQPTMLQGQTVEGVHLTFEEGVVVDHDAARNKGALTSLLETDGGSDRVGELGIGMNDDIDRVTKNTSLDEKMAGSVHLALGRAYGQTVGADRERNQSAVHRDFIKDMSETRLELDGEIVQENGEIVA